MKRFTITLRHLILFVAILSITLALISSMYSGYRIDKETLINNSLETNRVYAEKLAKMTDDFLNNSLRILQYSGREVAPYIGHDEERLLQETNRLKNQMNLFNSVSIVSADGEILAISPESLNIKNEILKSPGGKQALKEGKPLISMPFTGITGRLIIFISTPIFDETGEYLGLIGGSLYLKKKNILYELLGEHFYHDGSYVYVVDGNGQIIYHKDSERINDIVSSNSVVQQLMKRKSGSQRITNTKNQDMLAGYASVPSAGWGVVSQRATEIALSPAKKMVHEMFMKTFPLILITIMIISIFAKKIAQPLNLLAYYAENSRYLNRKTEFAAIKAPYYEAIELKRALKQSLSFLHERVDHFMHESTTDPLTKLTNRRTLTEKMNYWVANKTPFSLILIDIDRFKRVNDTYGHSVGDEVLQFLAKQMVQLARKDDVCCRYGGEEFIILLPYADREQSYQVAERLRTTLEKKESPTGKTITISSGISSYPDDAIDLEELIAIADRCLYQAKESGRNQTVFNKDIGR